MSNPHLTENKNSQPSNTKLKKIEEEAIENLIIEDEDFYHKPDFSKRMLYSKDPNPTTNNFKINRRGRPGQGWFHSTANSPEKEKKFKRNFSSDQLMEPLMKFGIKLEKDINSFLKRKVVKNKFLPRSRILRKRLPKAEKEKKEEPVRAKRTKFFSMLGKKRKKISVDFNEEKGNLRLKRRKNSKSNLKGKLNKPKKFSFALKNTFVTENDMKKKKKNNSVPFNENRRSSILGKERKEKFLPKGVKRKKIDLLNGKKKKKFNFLALKLSKAQMKKLQKMNVFQNKLAEVFEQAEKISENRKQNTLKKENIKKRRKTILKKATKYRCISARDSPNQDNTDKKFERKSSTIKIGKQYINLSSLMQKKIESDQIRKYYLQKNTSFQERFNSNKGKNFRDDKLKSEIGREVSKGSFWLSMTNGTYGDKYSRNKGRRAVRKNLARGLVPMKGRTGGGKRKEVENLRVLLGSLQNNGGFVNSKTVGVEAFMCPKVKWNCKGKRNGV